MWRDADGNIVAKRPTHPGQRSISRSVDNSDSRSPEGPKDDSQEVQAPLSPPRSQQDTDFSDAHLGTHYPEGLHPSDQSHMFEYVATVDIHEQGNDMYDFLANSSWGSKPSQTTQATMEKSNSRMWEDAFAPDTASSFNMPYTTAQNYSWLFDQGSASAYDIQMPAQMTDWLPQVTSQNLQPLNHSNMPTSQQPNVNSFRQAVPQQQQQPQPQPQHSLPMQAFLAHPEYQAAPSTQEQTMAPSQQGTVSHQASESDVSTSPEALSASDFSGASSCTSLSQHNASKRSHSTLSSQPPIPRHSEVSSVQSFHPFNPPRNLPRLDEAARNRMLDIIIQSGTRTPDGLLVTQDHPLLSLASLQNYCDLFFTRMNTVYPLIHQATFEPSEVEPLLLMAVVLLGATYSDKAAHRLAVCVHDIMRAQIFQHVAFSADPELWILQTILLVECFGKSRAGQKQHDLSHLFHGLLINLIRRSNCQTVHLPDISDSMEDDLETQWRTAMDVEQRKRLCQLCFMWDVQHAVLFSQSLCMSSFEIRTALPCNPAVWEATSAEEWHHHANREPAPKLFLPVLKSYMSPSAPTQSHNLNALSRLLILHGLLSISWDFNRRDQTSLGCGSVIESDDWRARIGASMDGWKADFDTYALNITSSLNKMSQTHNPEVRSDFQRFTTSTLAIYHAAHIILNIEILDLQIYAGARHIIGRPVNRNDYERSRRKVRDWAQQKPVAGTVTSNACTGVWHAAQLLRDGIMNLDNWDVNNAFHYPWCLYLATLTCWAFHYGSRDDRSATLPAMINYDNSREDAVSMSMGMYADDANESAMYDAKAQMNALVSGMTSGVPEGLWRIAGKYSTKGLTTVMAQHLSNVRWAVVHEGMKVLKGLMARHEAL